MQTWADVRAPEDARELRKYGLQMAAILAGGFGLAVPVLVSHRVVIWPWVLAVLFLAPALAFPRALAPVYVAWMRLGVVMGAVMSRVTLAILFFCVVTPLALVARAVGRDTMRRKTDRNSGSYRESRAQTINMEVPF